MCCRTAWKSWRKVTCQHSGNRGRINSYLLKSCHISAQESWTYASYERSLLPKIPPPVRNEFCSETIERESEKDLNPEGLRRYLGTREIEGESIDRFKIMQETTHRTLDFAVSQQGAFGDRPIRIFALEFHRGYMRYFVLVRANHVSKAETTTLQDAVKNLRIVHSVPPSRVSQTAQIFLTPHRA